MQFFTQIQIDRYEQKAVKTIWMFRLKDRNKKKKQILVFDINFQFSIIDLVKCMKLTDELQFFKKQKKI